MPSVEPTKIYCSVCMNEIEDGIGNDTVDGVVCDDCFDSYLMCESCEKMVHSDHTVSNDGDIYCQTCFDNEFTLCVRCGEYVSNNETYSPDSASGPYCESCYCDAFTRCEHCEDVIFMDDAYYSEERDATLCGDCYSDVENGNLHSYNYIPEPEFREVDGEKTDLYLGVELEIESKGNDFNDIVDELPDYFYAKQDGSIDSGFEVVSHPATYKWLKQNSEMWDENVLNLRNQGFRSYNTNTCGMHIHLSKAAFSTLHLLKFLHLFYDNPAFVLRISQRKAENLQKWASVDGDGMTLCYKAKWKENPERYSALNMLCSDTIEIRIFRGNLNPAAFWKNIEFAKAAYEYTRNESVSKVSVSGFTEFVGVNKKDYPNLQHFLERIEEIICA